MILVLLNVSCTDLPDLMVTISTSGSIEVGRSLNITCTVVLVEGLVGNITITWDKLDGISELEELNIPVVRVSDGSVTNVTLMLDPVLFNYRGLYMCETMYNVSQTFDAESLTADTEISTLSKFFITITYIIIACTLKLYAPFPFQFLLPQCQCLSPPVVLYMRVLY